MLIGLARPRPKKVYGTVKLFCLWGGYCEEKCFRSFSDENHCIISFYFTPKLSGLVFVITEEIDFYVLVIAEVVSNRERNGDLQMPFRRYDNICRYSSCRWKWIPLYLYCCSVTTAPCSLPQQYKELDLEQ